MSSSGEKLLRVESPLAPVVDDTCVVLLLGTMPSPVSRARGIHYGNPQNRFWPTMAALWGCDVPATAEGKRALCLEHHIALDDVLLACSIKGAQDASIENPEPNDLGRILSRAPIRKIFCTGSAAYKLYGTYIEPTVGILAHKLPSTSPANARWSQEALIEAYAPVREAVLEAYPEEGHGH
ncbi:MAG: DNA-deoxyinosine glycosylase [Atopobiaceae bacterium]